MSRVRLLFRTPLQLVRQICISVLATFTFFDTLPQNSLPAAEYKWGQERSPLSAFHQGSIVRRDSVGTPRLLAAAGVIELKGFAAQLTSPPLPALNLLNRTNSPPFSPQAPGQSPPGRKRNSRLNTGPCKKLDRRLLQIITLIYPEYIVRNFLFLPSAGNRGALAGARVAGGDCDVAEWELETAEKCHHPNILLLPTRINISTLYHYVWAIPFSSKVL